MQTKDYNDIKFKKNKNLNTDSNFYEFKFSNADTAFSNSNVKNI
jgi:hypothetical protein